MAAYVKFDSYGEALHRGVHQWHAAGHTFRVYLTNATPNAATHTVKADLAEIAAGNGYAGAADIQNDVSRAGGTTSLTGVDVVVTATGPVGPFRYVVLYNDTAANDELVAYWDYGQAVTLGTGETFTIDVGAALATFA